MASGRAAGSYTIRYENTGQNLTGSGVRSAKMPGLRVRGQQAESHRDFLQHLPGEVPAALAGQIVPDFAEIVFALGREDVARH
jgi:hypothetical protein